jgi:hypothetical protein
VWWNIKQFFRHANESQSNSHANSDTASNTSAASYANATADTRTATNSIVQQCSHRDA